MADVTVEFGAKDVGLEDALRKVQTEMTGLQEKVKTGDMSLEEIEKTMKRIGQVEGLEKKLKAMGDKSAESAPQVDGLTREIKKTGDASEQTGKQSEVGFGKIFSAAAAAQVAVNVAGAAMEAAFAAVRNAIGEFGKALELGGKLSDLSDRTGESAGNLLVLGRAFQNTGKSADDAGVTLNKMQKYIEEAASGASANAPVFEDLKINLDELRKKSPIEQMQILAERIAGLENPGKQATLTMEMFGKSGGELLPFLKNFSEELQTAKAELGSTTDIMNRQNRVFDAVSDKIKVVRDKFTELAAGILDKTVPALAAITEGLSRIDAAAIGQNLANAFIGGQEAMKGFQAAVDAIKLGKIDEAFSLLWDSIKLQVMESANAITRNFQAAFQAGVDFAAKIFDPSGSFAKLIGGFTEWLGSKLAAAVSDALAGILWKNEYTRSWANGLHDTAEEARKQADKIGSNFGGMIDNVAKDMVKAGKALPETFRDEYERTSGIFKNLQEDTQAIANKQGDITEELENQDYYRSLALEKTKGERKEIEENLSAREKSDKREKELAAQQKKDQAELAEQRKKEQQENLKLDLKIAEAKASGRTEEVKALEAKKEFNKLLKQAIDSGMGVAEARNFALAMMDANTNSRAISVPGFKNPAEQAAAMAKDLGDAANFVEAMKKVREIESVKEGAKDSKKAREEIEAFGEYIGVKLKGVAIPDILEKLGIKDISKNGEEQMDALLEYIKKVRSDLSTNPLDSEAAEKTIEGIRSKFENSKFQLNPDGAPVLQLLEDIKKDAEKMQAKVKVQVDANIEAAQTAIDSINLPSLTVPVNADLSSANDTISAFSPKPLTLTLDAADSIQKIRNSLSSEPIKVQLDTSSTGSGGGSSSSVFDAIKTAVEDARDLLRKIEPKLPVNALTA